MLLQLKSTSGLGRLSILTIELVDDNLCHSIGQDMKTYISNLYYKNTMYDPLPYYGQNCSLEILGNPYVLDYLEIEMRKDEVVYQITIPIEIKTDPFPRFISELHLTPGNR